MVNEFANLNVKSEGDRGAPRGRPCQACSCDSVLSFVATSNLALHVTISHQTAAMLDVEDFDAVFQGLNYTTGVVNEIQECQHALGGKTFFERLLELLRIDGTMQQV